MSKKRAKELRRRRAELCAEIRKYGSLEERFGHTPHSLSIPEYNLRRELELVEDDLRLQDPDAGSVGGRLRRPAWRIEYPRRGAEVLELYAGAERVGLTEKLAGGLYILAMNPGLVPHKTFDAEASGLKTFTSLVWRRKLGERLKRQGYSAADVRSLVVTVKGKGYRLRVETVQLRGFGQVRDVPLRADE